MGKTIILTLTILVLNSCNFGKKDKPLQRTPLRKDTLANNSMANYPYERFTNDSIALLQLGGSKKLSFKFNVDSTGFFLKTIIIYSDNVQTQEIITNKFMISMCLCG